MKLIDTELLVTGNGFDLSLGYKTDYASFYNFLLALCKAKNVDEIKAIYKDYDSKTLDKNFDEFKRISENNYFVKYLIAYKEKFESWFQFESKLSDILIVFDHIFSSFSNAYQSLNVYEFKLEKDGALELYSSPFNDLLPGYKLDHRDYINAQITDTDYKGPYDFFSVSKRIDYIKKDIKNKLKINLHDFKKTLGFYIHLETNRKVESMIPRIRPSRAVTFNYSDLTEKTFSIDNDYCCHFHGKCGPNIVVGIDTESFKNPEFNIFDKCFQRTNVHGQEKLHSLISGCKVVTYIGFSFDICDSSFVKYIFDVKDIEHIILFKDKDGKDDLVENIIQIIGKKKFTDLMNDGKFSFYPLNKNVITQEEYKKLLEHDPE